MPKRIARLQEDVVNRIAAGEVIQRPANAVKEMLENALDAGSKSVSVVVKHGGLKMLQIQDDGHGIDRADLDIVCERFTTSKLSKFEDLTTISTHGFRGEALASISHVAHLSIMSRTKDSPCAFRAHYRDGKLCPPKPGKSTDPKPCAGNQGTQITVEDLFYNVPTRRKALKSPSDELNRIMDIMSRYAVHNAGVAFSLKKQGETKPLLRTSPGATTKETIGTIYGSKVAAELLEIEEEDSDLHFRLHGFITNANYSVKKPTLLLFINSRAVHSTNIRRALDSVYAAYLPRHTHCFAYISLDIKPENVDVNVHPTKKEVHFLHEEDIVERLQEIVSKRLLGGNMSRTFQTQTLLPGASGARNFLSADSAASAAEGHDNDDGGRASGSQGARPSSSSTGRRQQRGLRDDGTRVYDHDLIRTDARAQTLDKFLSASQAPAMDVPASVVNTQSSSTGPAIKAGGSSRAADDNNDDDDDDDGNDAGNGGEPEMVWDPIRLRMKPAKKQTKTQTADTGGSTTMGMGGHSGVGSNDDGTPQRKRAHVQSGSAGSGDDNEQGCAPQSQAGEGEAIVISSGESEQLSGTTTTSDSAPTQESPSQQKQHQQQQQQQQNNNGGAASLGRPWPESHTQLTSVLELRDALIEQQHSVLRAIFKEHVYVGCVGDKLLLIQHQRHLYLVKLPEVCRVLFRQLCLRGFGDMSSLNLSPPAPVYDLVLAALDSPEANWQEEDGPKPQLAEFITDFLKDKSEMLDEYFGLFVNESGELERIPALMHGHTPDLNALPTFLLRLATEVDWDVEKGCFDSVAREIGLFYASFDKAQAEAENPQQSNDDDISCKPISWLVEHSLAPALRNMFFPPKSLADDGAIVQIADLKELYKVFERC